MKKTKIWQIVCMLFMNALAIGVICFCGYAALAIIFGFFNAPADDMFYHIQWWIVCAVLFSVVIIAVSIIYLVSVLKKRNGHAAYVCKEIVLWAFFLLATFVYALAFCIGMPINWFGIIFGVCAFIFCIYLFVHKYTKNGRQPAVQTEENKNERP